MRRPSRGSGRPTDLGCRCSQGHGLLCLSSPVGVDLIPAVFGVYLFLGFSRTGPWPEPWFPLRGRISASRLSAATWPMWRQDCLRVAKHKMVYAARNVVKAGTENVFWKRGKRFSSKARNRLTSNVNVWRTTNPDGMVVPEIDLQRQAGCTRY